MAEFSKEYFQINEIELSGDFCINDEFVKLREGESLKIICEGFGITEIFKNKDECWIKFRDNKMSLKEFIFNHEM